MKIEKSELTAPTIVCGGCANGIRKALGVMPGVTDVQVDIPTKKVTITHDERLGLKEIVSVLDRAGFPTETAA